MCDCTSALVGLQYLLALKTSALRTECVTLSPLLSKQLPEALFRPRDTRLSLRAVIVRGSSVRGVCSLERMLTTR
jgi:hypothetical protein